MRKLLVVAVAVFTAGACHSPADPGTPALEAVATTLVGSYSLTQVNGGALPAPVILAGITYGTIVKGTLTITNADVWRVDTEEHTLYGAPVFGHSGGIIVVENATYVFRDSTQTRVAFRGNPSGNDLPLSVSPLTQTNPAITWTFTRQP